MLTPLQKKKKEKKNNTDLIILFGVFFLTLSTIVAALEALTVMETIARVIPTAATTKT